jgi:tRNA pseudouridine38-40 synthase
LGLGLSLSQRYKLTIAYDGTNYVGWQIQKNGLAVQAVLEKALRRISGETIRPVGSGRTDAGVHALAQVAHFDLNWGHTALDLQKALNSLLPVDIVIRDVEAVSADFHAQKSAQEKWYRYVICSRPRAVHEPPLPFMRDYAWHFDSPLRIGMMRKAAKHLQGRHDFKSFQGSGGMVKTTVRTLKKIVIRNVRLESLAGTQPPSPKRLRRPSMGVPLQTLSQRVRGHRCKYGSSVTRYLSNYPKRLQLYGHTAEMQSYPGSTPQDPAYVY